jgi:anti-sigma factor RsiW
LDVLVTDGAHQIEMNIFAAQVFKQVQALPEVQRETVLLIYAAHRRNFGSGERFSAALAKSSMRGRDRFPRRLLAAAAAILLLLGGVAGYLIAKPPVGLFEEADRDEDEWVDAVAGQMSLYDVDEAERQAQLRALGQALNLDLSESRVALEGLTLKRAELLHFQGRHLAQVLYTSNEHGPIALCIMAESGGEGEAEVESRDGLNLTYWFAAGRRFLLIGAAPPKRIDALAGTVASRFRS